MGQDTTLSHNKKRSENGRLIFDTLYLGMIGNTIADGRSAS